MFHRQGEDRREFGMVAAAHHPRCWRLRLPAPRVVAALLLSLASITCSVAKKAAPGEPMVTAIEPNEATSSFGMVSTASADATRAAIRMLESRGNAVDAAVAAAFTLGTGEAAGSGLGGMTYIVIRFANGRAVAIDGSALMPMQTDRRRLKECQEQNRAADEELTAGYEFVAVPGTLAALAHCAQRYGTKSLAALLEPAIETAEGGYVITEAKWASIEKYFAVIRRSENLRFWVLNNGETIPEIGERLCNPELARTLRAISARGPDFFYRGPIASAIEADMEAHGGFVRRNDLALIKAREVEPLRGSYRGAEIIGFPEPGGGGAVIEALNILENFPQSLLTEDTTERIRVQAEAFHIALEDWIRTQKSRNTSEQIMGPQCVSKEYAARMAALIRLGRPLTEEDFPPFPGERRLPGGTTQISVVDRYGNVVALTQTIGRFYGAKALTPSLGFPYNSLLETCDPDDSNQFKLRAPIATQMSPTIVNVDGQMFVSLGSSGSAKVPSTVTYIISNLLDRGMPLGSAVAFPRVLWTVRGKNSMLDLEVAPPVTKRMLDDLKALGYTKLELVEYPAPRKLINRLGAANAVLFDSRSATFVGTADARRSGNAAGPRL